MTAGGKKKRYLSRSLPSPFPTLVKSSVSDKRDFISLKLYVNSTEREEDGNGRRGFTATSPLFFSLLHHHKPERSRKNQANDGPTQKSPLLPPSISGPVIHFPLKEQFPDTLSSFFIKAVVAIASSSSPLTPKSALRKQWLQHCTCSRSFVWDQEMLPLFFYVQVDNLHCCVTQYLTLTYA